MKSAFFRFFPDDWRRDCACLSPAARGLWMEFIAYAWSIGKPCLEHCLEHFSRVLFASEKQMLDALQEWEEHGTAEIERLPGDRVRIRCRRMERDMEIQRAEREKKTAKAKIAAGARWSVKPASDATSIAPSNAQSNARGHAHAMPSAASAADSTLSLPAAGQEPVLAAEHATAHPQSNPLTLEATVAIFNNTGGERELAEQWWNEMEACGWVDYRQRPIRKPRALIADFIRHRRAREHEQSRRPSARPPRHCQAAAAQAIADTKPLTQEEMDNLQLIRE